MYPPASPVQNWSVNLILRPHKDNFYCIPSSFLRFYGRHRISCGKPPACSAKIVCSSAEKHYGCCAAQGVLALAWILPIWAPLYKINSVSSGSTGTAAEPQDPQFAAVPFVPTEGGKKKMQALGWKGVQSILLQMHFIHKMDDDFGFSGFPKCLGFSWRI